MKITYTYIFSLLSVLCFSQSYFNKRYNEIGYFSSDRGLAIKEYNNSYFVLGFIDENKERALGLIPYTGYATDTMRVLALNITKQGEEIFNKSLPPNLSCDVECQAMVINKDGLTTAGAYFTAGSYCGSAPPGLPTPPGYPGNSNCIIMQTDFNGNIKWLTTFGNSEKEGVWGLSESHTDGYMALCVTSQNNSTYLVELNSQGDSVHKIDLTFNRSDIVPQHLEKTPTGYVAFYQQSSLAKTRAIIMNINGDTIGSKIIPMYKPTYFKSTHDGGFIAVQDFGYTGLQTRLFKLDKDLNLEWTNTYDANTGFFVTETNDGNYIIGLKDFAKVDNKGNVLWKKRFFGESNISPYYRLTDGVQTSDGGYAITGVYEFNTIIIKTDCNGNVEWNTSSCLLPTDKDALVFPNPFNDIVTIQLPNINKDVDKVTLKITDLLGQVLVSNDYLNQNIITLNTSSFNQSLYIYSIYLNDKFYQSGKIIKE